MNQELTSFEEVKTLVNNLESLNEQLQAFIVRFQGVVFVIRESFQEKTCDHRNISTRNDLDNYNRTPTRVCLDCRKHIS
jgi:hypothetical protein